MTSKRKELINGMNEGKNPCAVGSTSMLGTGVNAQKEPLLFTIWIHRGDRDLANVMGGFNPKGNEIAKFFANNKVAVIIYAVEKIILDSYKFNLLRNKQLFIDQLKNNNLTKRTIDEGSMDEKSE